MAWMASARMVSALALTASSSLSSPVTICGLKSLCSADFYSSSASSFSRRLSRLVLAEISALASRVAFFWFSSLHLSAMSAFRGAWECLNSILCCAAFTSARKKGRWPAGQSLTRSDSGSWDSICSRISFILLESSTRVLIGADSRSLMS